MTESDIIILAAGDGLGEVVAVAVILGISAVGALLKKSAEKRVRSSSGGAARRADSILTFPHTPQLLVAWKLRRSGSRSMRTSGRSVT